MLIDSVDTNKLIAEKFLKRLYELSIKSIGKIPQLEEPNQEQKDWIKRRMRGMK